MKTIDLPRSLAAYLHPNGENVRTSLEWQSSGGGKGKGKKAAKSHLQGSDHDYVAMLWKSGNVTLYVLTRDGEVVRVRFTN